MSSRRPIEQTTETHDRPVVSLPVRESPACTIRPSRMSRRRAGVLIGIHVLILGHVLHWLYTGRTLSPVEPSEAMYTLRDGYVNAGFIFFTVTLLATAVAGRFLCGWGCHVVAYQDLCAWLLKKMRIKVRPLRSRLLVLAPLALALYMFVWPSAYLWWIGRERPALTNHLTTAEFWATFPGPVVAVLTILICGFAVVYFLGAKGFCTYACPYGGFFGLMDRLAPGRIVVSDACEHCGHCTAVCSSNVRVHEEVALYGMVVDPGCMKCMDCVSVCPNDALHVGFKRPSLGAKPARPRKAVPYTFALAEEGVMVIVGLAALLIFRGLYGRIPLLMAMGLAAMTAYLFMLTQRMLRSVNVRLQQFQLKRGGRFTRAGGCFTVFAVLYFGLTLHSAVVRCDSWTGHRAFVSARLGDDIWYADYSWWDHAEETAKAHVASADAHLTRADRWGLFSTPSVLTDLVRLNLAKGDDAEAERAMRRLVALFPHRAEFQRGLGNVLRKRGKVEDAERAYRRALAIKPDFSLARADWGAMLVPEGRHEEALHLYREGARISSDAAKWRIQSARLLMDLGRLDEAKAALELDEQDRSTSAEELSLSGILSLRLGKRNEGFTLLQEAVERDPTSASARYNLGFARLQRQGAAAALPHLKEAVRLAPNVALYRYNLAVATFMTGDADKALSQIREAVRLDPTDPDAHGFMAVVLRELGDEAGAASAETEAQRLRDRR